MFAFTGCMFLPINTLLARWFVDKKGLATGITYAGAGIGGVILSPVLSQCIAASGWRMTYIYIAIASAVCAVILFIFIRNKPEDVGQAPAREEGTEYADRAG